VKLSISLSIGTLIAQAARFARDLWDIINDTWQLEERKWEDII
jgi:hypothetical protein